MVCNNDSDTRSNDGAQGLGSEIIAIHATNLEMATHYSM